MKRNLIKLLCTVLLLFCTACSDSDQSYQFPPTQNDIEKTLVEQKLAWHVTEVNKVQDSNVIFALENDDGVSLGVNCNEYENNRVLSLTWSMPRACTDEQMNVFYGKELPRLFDLAVALYGDSKELKKSLEEFFAYYRNADGKFEGGLYWTNRAGDEHLQIDIKSADGDKRNRTGIMFIVHGDAYEYFLELQRESWVKVSQIDSIEINNSTVSAMTAAPQRLDKPDFWGEHFCVQGRLEEVKEIKSMPESLKTTISSRFLKPNRDKYLSAKLIDDTDSIDVFLQTTSLNTGELKRERCHYLVLYYYENEPFYVVRFSPLIK